MAKVQYVKEGEHLYPKTKAKYVEGIVSEDLLLTSKYDFLIHQLSRSDIKWGSTREALNFLHFSDIHGDSINIDRIVKFRNKYNSLIDDSICTGDIVNYQFTDDISFMDINGANNILLSVGNHDTYKNGSWNGATELETHNLLLKNKDLWNIVSSGNVCYYYKDYSAKRIRLIVLDCMHWNTTQSSWFDSTLNDAKSLGYAVLIATHIAPKEVSDADFSNPFDSPTSNKGWESDGYAQSFFNNNNIPEKIETFKQGGGEFICYFGGHTHCDIFRKLKGYNQLMFCTTNASCDDNVQHADGANYRKNGTISQDCFNILSIDRTSKTLTIARIGMDTDRLGRHIGVTVYDYHNNNVVYNY